jgi:hypothetical protein
MENPAGSTTPIVCDRSTATGTPAEGIAEYRRLFTRALVGREKTADGIVFRFRADDGIEAWVRDLAAREKACCAFFTFTITEREGQVWWETGVPDDELARAVLDEFYTLPDTVADGVEALEERFTRRGLRMIKGPAETRR